MEEEKIIQAQAAAAEAEEAAALGTEPASDTDLKQEILALKQLILDQNKEIEKIRKLEKSDKTRTALVFVLVFAILLALAIFLPKVSRQLDNIQEMIADATSQVTVLTEQAQTKFDELAEMIDASDLEALDELLAQLPEITSTIKGVQNTLAPLLNLFGGGR